MRLGQECVSKALIRSWLDRVQSDNARIVADYDLDWAVGVWYDKGFVYLDVVNVVEDRDEAIRLGRERSQLALRPVGRCRDSSGLSPVAHWSSGTEPEGPVDNCAR
ncbi:MAG: hypothetical protein NTW96_27595 [Planctomycetia bacterium]|nr:hypothetical protein [Planctomycetia bacterium]